MTFLLHAVLAFVLLVSFTTTAGAQDERILVFHTEGDRLTTASLTSDGEVPYIKVISDPLEPMNRAFFVFNHQLMSWIIIPVEKVYKFIMPRPARRSIDNFAENLSYPVRAINALLQGKGAASWDETERFFVNTTVGVLGLFDPASKWGMPKHNEDFGQTFGHYGLNPGFYLYMPLFGPTSGRDLVGRGGDMLANPATYIPFAGAAFRINSLSFFINQYIYNTSTYEDPYIIFRDYWSLNRQKDVVDYELEPLGENPGADPTLQSTFFHVKDRSFGRNLRERKVKLDVTGESFPYSLWLQKEPAPVIFIIPGGRGHRNSEFTWALAEMAYNRGFSTVAVSSVLNFEFIENASATAVPGYSSRDAADMHHALIAVKRDLMAKYADRITTTSLLGFSIGGHHALQIAAREASGPSNTPRFDRIVAVNPVLDMFYAIKQLDTYYNAPLSWPPDVRKHNMEEALLKASALIGNPQQLSDPISVFDRTESQYLIGIYFRNALREFVYVSQKEQNLGVLDAKFRLLSRKGVYDEIFNISFVDYFNDFALPYYKNHEDYRVTRDDFVAAAKARNLGEGLIENSRIRVFVSENDFLMEEQDLEWLSDTLEDRLTIFPGGGHGGNLYLPQVQDKIMESFKNSK